MNAAGCGPRQALRTQGLGHRSAAASLPPLSARCRRGAAADPDGTAGSLRQHSLRPRDRPPCSDGRPLALFGHFSRLLNGSETSTAGHGSPTQGGPHAGSDARGGRLTHTPSREPGVGVTGWRRGSRGERLRNEAGETGRDRAAEGPMEGQRLRRRRNGPGLGGDRTRGQGSGEALRAPAPDLGGAE